MKNIQFMEGELSQVSHREGGFSENTHEMPHYTGEKNLIGRLAGGGGGVSHEKNMQGEELSQVCHEGGGKKALVNTQKRKTEKLYFRVFVKWYLGYFEQKAHLVTMSRNRGQL